MNPKLTPQQVKFVAEYVKSSNATESAIKAGYSPKTAAQSASRLLSSVKISEMIQKVKDATISSAIISKQKALEILSEIASADLTNFMTVGADGVSFYDVGPETLGKKALKEFTTKTVRDEHGNTIQETAFNNLKLEDRQKAIELLGKFLGWNAPDKLNITGGIVVLEKPWRNPKSDNTKAKQSSD